MFCVLVGIVPPRKELWECVRREVTNDKDGTAMEWRSDYSLVQDVDNNGETTLIMAAMSKTPATPKSVVEAVKMVLMKQSSNSTASCELWASAPALLPIRPLDGYDKAIANIEAEPSKNDIYWEDRAAAAMREWGMVMQPQVLDAEQVTELRGVVDAAIAKMKQALAVYHPDICVGKDVFLFREIASRNLERFDLRLTSSVAQELVQRNIIVGRANALLLKVFGSLEKIDFDISVVYSRPGACKQGWHADGNHQKGASDAGWSEHGWKTQLADSYAICLFIPLIDLNDEVGFTRFWPASHRNRDLIGFGRVAEVIQATVDAKCSAGDGVWYDYRLLHQGMPNRSTVIRPVVQIIFKKKWYVEKANYGLESIFAKTENEKEAPLSVSG